LAEFPFASTLHDSLLQSINALTEKLRKSVNKLPLCANVLNRLDTMSAPIAAPTVSRAAQHFAEFEKAISQDRINITGSFKQNENFIFQLHCV
jgi:hypothetical protein